MKIQSSRFGEIEYPEEVLIQFPEGILGFPDDSRYLLLEHDHENSPFKWLQSATTPDLAFIVIDPLLIVAVYPLMIDCDTAGFIGTTDPANCACMSIVNVPAADPIKMTANLKAPLLVNTEMRLGRQIILGSQAFSVSEPIFPRLNERTAELAHSEKIPTAQAAEG